MADDDANIVQKDTNINDLISEDVEVRKKVKITTEDQEQKFKEKMKEIRIKEKEKAAQERAENLEINYINLAGFPISPEVLSLISKEQAQELRTIIFLKTSDQLRIGTTNPNNPEVLQLLSTLEEKEGVHGEIYLISDYSFEKALKLYDYLPKHRKFTGGLEISENDLEKFKKGMKSFRDINSQAQKASITEVLTVLVAGAIQSRASDIHVEAEESDVKIRYRIDGVLHEVAFLPKESWPKIISRIKLLSGLKINITNVPQDGRFTIYLTNEFIDVRVSCVPTTFGESVVMRLLMSSAIGLELEDLGIRGQAFAQLQHEIIRPNGMILATGPTGSGKTTTLYAFMKKLNQPETKIMSLENPIEYRIVGINQSQIDEKLNYSFAKGLKSILRQDPDIVMVGEIRDPETAEIAIQAALTGHIMLSTLHTNNAAGAIPRLLSMAVKPYLLAPALNSIIGQRLVRRICQNCTQETKISENDLERVKAIIKKLPPSVDLKIDLGNLKFYKGKGCDECNQIGYKDRVGIFEVMIMNEEIEKLILSGQVSEHQLQEIAIRNGMVAMVQDGVLKAIDGITTVEEVFKVTE